MTHDLNKDGEVDLFDQQAEWRAQDQAESDAFVKQVWTAISQTVTGFALVMYRLPGRVAAVAKRVRIIARVQIVAESVGDAEALYARLFQFPPADPGHESYRRAFVAVALEKRKTRAQWLTFADMLDGLQAYDETPVDAWLLLRPAPRPALTAPRPPLTPVDTASVPLGIAGIPGTPPIPGLNWFTQILAVALVISIGWGLWMRGEAKNAKLYRERAETAEIRNTGLADALKDAGAAMEKDRAVMADFQNRIAERAAQDAALSTKQAGIRRREKERFDAVRNGGAVPDDEFLRELAEPASVGGDPVPADPADATAAGILGEMHGTTGADAAQPDPSTQR